MADIFISYRHGDIDSLAAYALAARLDGSPYSTFFDRKRQSLDFGDDFPEEIDDALTQCRVVFAVIGPSWLTDGNLARLAESGDWVAYELGVALRRPEVRIVPVFVQPAVTSFGGRLLPPTLQVLSRKHALSLSSVNPAPDCESIVTWLGSYFSELRPQFAAPREPPPMLPYLCNRVTQEGRFVALFEGAPRTGWFACVVHGHKAESHDELLERFRHTGVIRDAFRSVDDGPVPCYALQLDDSQLRAGVFAGALKSALKVALGRRTASDAELRDYLSALSQTLVFKVQVTWTLYTQVGDGLVNNLIAGWRSLLVSHPDARPSALPYPALLWINVAYGDDRQVPSGSAEWLPQLAPIEDWHIREWAGLDQVEPHVRRKKQQLLALAEDERYCFAPGRLHMSAFAEAVHHIMST